MAKSSSAAARPASGGTASPGKTKSRDPFSRLPRGAQWAIVIALALLLAGAIAWYYFIGRVPSESAGRLSVSKDIGEAQRAPPKPVAPPPPAELTHTVKAGESLWSIAKEGELVGSAWEWRTILVQNRDKIQYTFLSEDDGGWKVMVAEGQQLKVKRDSPPTLPDGQGSPDRRFAVQVLTVPDTGLERAVGLVRMLLADGQYAYLYRKEDEGKRWFRIRVGFFRSEDEARQAGQALLARYAERKVFKEFWVMRPSELELKGGHLDYGVQQAKPWVVELPQRGTHHQALEDLRTVSSASDFVYIAQKRDGTSQPAPYVYRTRIGFFASEAEAQDFIASHKAAAPLLGEGQAAQVERFEEALPGQNLRLGKPTQG
jgi:LysM repeat protein